MSNKKNTHNKNNIEIISNSEDKSKISADILTENFETLAKAKGGIPKLRETILQLAVQGKLVSQNPEDEPASVLLKKIQAEKTRLVKEGKIKKQKPLPPVDLEEVPYEIPKTWEWGYITEFFSSLPISKNKILNSEISNIGKYPVIDQGKEFISGYYNDSSKLVKLYHPVVIFGDHTREIKYIDFDFIPGADGTKVLNPLNGYPKFFYLYLKSLNFEKKGYSRYFKFLKENFFPLPPLAEQHRIVKRVDKLMKLCDELEARQNTESETRRMLLLSSLNCLLEAEDDARADVAREILKSNFDNLFDDRESIAEMRKAILQLAVQGRLSEQNSEDEPAAVLLEKIQAEKERLVKEEKIKKQKPLPPVSPEEVPYEIPEGWVWTRLGEVIELISGQHIQKSDYYDSPKGIPYITGPIDFGEKYPIISKWTDKPKSLSKENNILVTVKGAGLGKNNLSNIPKLAISRQLMAINCIIIDYNFVFYFIKSKYDYFQKKGVGIAIPGLSRENVTFINFPLPPLAEQHRIVERVDTLMKLCDELEERVLAKENAAERLLLSVCDGICR